MSDLEELKKELKEKGMDYERLAVLMLGGEQIIGEVQDVEIEAKFGPPESIVGRVITVKNPKRYLRLQRMAQDGSAMSIDVFVGGLDLIEDDGSVMQLFPIGGYWVRHLGPGSQREFLKTLMMFFKHRMMARAAKAGLITPDGRLNIGGMSGKG